MTIIPIALSTRRKIINIRSETLADLPLIDSVTTRAFRDTSDGGQTECFIVNTLRNAGKLSISLVADIDGDIAGHIVVSPVSISDNSKNWYAVGPLSVAPEHQGQGIGSKLMAQAITRLKGLGAAGCVLVGDPQYYSRFGFKTEAKLTFADVPPEYLQALAFSSHTPEGEVIYHKAFYTTKKQGAE